MRNILAVLLSVVLLSMACGRAASTPGSPPPVSSTLPAAPLHSSATTPVPPAYIPPQCENLPIATIPVTTTVTEAAPAIQANPTLTTEQQLRVLDGLVNAIRDHYIYPEAIDDDWLAKVDETRSRVEAGVATESFYSEMGPLVTALGDEHSYFQTPLEVAEDAARTSGTYDLVGVGALFQPLDENGWAAVLAAFEGGPAWYAGLHPHDALLAVDGGPIREPSGRSRTLGPECSAVVLTIQTPGQEPRDLTLIRSSVSAPMPIYPQLVPTSDGSKVGYIFIPTLLDKVIPETVRQALEEFGPLDGLILDNRMNGGGLGSASEQILGLFTSGYVGDYVSRETIEAWEIVGNPIHNSLDVPLVVLVGEDTVSYGEIMSGVLEESGRAHLVGQATLGNVEQLRRFDFEDGSATWLASARFDPITSEADWEAEGLVPEIEVIAAWDTFTFETDPAIAAALTLLGH